MQQVAILQMTNGEPDVSSSATTYAELVQQWGLPTVHTQLLQELKTWVETVPALHRQPLVALERIVDIEGSILMDASVAGLAAEHIPFLYTVLGEVFEELGRGFRRALHREAALAEKAHEDDMHQQMGEAGTDDRLDAVHDMENVALQTPPGTARTRHALGRGTWRGGYRGALTVRILGLCAILPALWQECLYASYPSS